jgi:hypothetical protein
MGMSVSEWNELQEELIQRIALRYKRHQAIWIPGNVPSLKNSKEIFQIYRTSSTCCKAPMLKTKVSGDLRYFCSKCRKPQPLKRPIITSSKTIKTYKENSMDNYFDNLYVWKSLTRKMNPPFILGIFHVRDSKRSFDYGNASEVILDAMTEMKYWEDDISDIVVPLHLGYIIDKTAPGVFLIPLEKSYMREVIKMI